MRLSSPWEPRACWRMARLLKHRRPHQIRVGVWRGTSLCRVHSSPCKDEIVVYRITRLNATDGLSIDARKIVNGQEEEMGVLDCLLEASGTRITCTIPKGAFRFTVRGDSLVGEARLRDNTKYRDVSTARSR